MSEEQKDKKKVKTLTPLKRHIQDEKKALRNRIWKSRIHTARISHSKLTDEEEKKSSLSLLQSLMDKAVKHGIFKKNKAARLKSRL